MNKISLEEFNHYFSNLKKSLLASYQKRKQEEAFSSFNTEAGLEVTPPEPVLHLESVGQDEEERQAHHTDKYELTTGQHPTPIYRRGQAFSLFLRFSGDFKPGEDILHLKISYGPNASYTKGTKFNIPTSETDKIDIHEWGMWIEENDGPLVKVKVQPPVECQIGLWRYKIYVSRKDSQAESEQFSSAGTIFYVLFNPWCKDDEVFMEEEERREDYVVRDYGYIYLGTDKKQVALRWIYGQFDYCVLPALMLLLESSNLKHHKRGSAVLVARAISTIINSNDDGGLVMGNWSGTYFKGTSPDAWTGSIAIYEQYLQSGCHSVKYGQCWVFAGCVTTACRALGIPCRTVTCFKSAHDTDNTLSIDYFHDKNGRSLERNQDSVWNYHCWNEVWFARPDLNPRYDGWQVIDATPQELSKGLYRLGPAPVKAVHEGDIGLDYDVTFVFSEVNADSCYFQQDSRSSWGFSLIGYETDTLGKLLVTQGIKEGPNKEPYMQNITDEYKYPEGSKKERRAFYRALKQCPKAQKFYKQFYHIKVEKEVTFKLDEFDSLVFGEPFAISVTAKNASDEVHLVDVCLTASAILYTGRSVDLIKQGDMQIKLNPDESRTIKMEVRKEEYMAKLQHTNNIKLATVCKVKETEEVYTADSVCEVIKPTAVVEVPESADVGVFFKAVFRVHNPTNEVFTNCQLSIEGSAMQRPLTVNVENVPVGGYMEQVAMIKPRRPGVCALVSNFWCDQLSNVNGSATLVINPPK